MCDTLQRLTHKTSWLHLLLSWFVAGKAAGRTAGSSQVSSQGTASKQHPAKMVGWVQGEAELYRWHNSKLVSFCLPRVSGGLMRKGVAMLLRERPGFSTLRSVQVPQELFFEEFDFLERFRNNAWVVLLVTPVTLKGSLPVGEFLYTQNFVLIWLAGPVFTCLAGLYTSVKY